MEGETYKHRQREIWREKVIHTDRKRFGGRKHIHIDREREREREERERERDIWREKVMYID